MSKLCRPKHNFSTDILIENENMENADANNCCVSPILEARTSTDFEYDSPSQIACTQEGAENFDVVWDWNSPQGKQKPRRTQSRLITQSPKIPLKRHPSNNQIQNFEKLREELKSLREEMSVPDNEESLLLSPLEEAKFKNMDSIQNNDNGIPLTQEIFFSNSQEDIFDDSIDEQLLLFTQKIENDLNTVGQLQIPNKPVIKSENEQNLKSEQELCKTTSVKAKKFIFHKYKMSSDTTKLADDSFDKLLQDFKVDHLDEIGKVSGVNKNQESKDKGSLNFPRTMSENKCIPSRPLNSGKVEFHRTQSFELSTLENTKEFPQSILNEIERKRKEALAKLESKKKQENNESLFMCTPEEIEQKRLQAIAKREAKKQQEIIERKRQEALKRLEINRRKNALIVKSSLSKREDIT